MFFMCLSYDDSFTTVTYLYIVVPIVSQCIVSLLLYRGRYRNSYLLSVVQVPEKYKVQPCTVSRDSSLTIDTESLMLQ